MVAGLRIYQLKGGLFAKSDRFSAHLRKNFYNNLLSIDLYEFFENNPFQWGR